MSDTPIIELRGATKRFELPDGRVTTAVKDVDYTVEDRAGQGEFRVLLGPSGCGKSTLLNMIAGLTLPTEGKVLVRGKPVTGPGPDRGFVFQNYSSFPWQTTLENVAFGLKLGGVPSGEREQIARAYLKKVGLEGAEEKYPHQLSGGMRQRVAIARTLAVGPRIVLMDEPFGALDVGIRLDMQDLLRRIWQELEATIVFVTHDIAEAVYLADEIVIMAPSPGRIAEVVPVDLPAYRDRSVEKHPRFRQLEEHVVDRIRALAKREPTPPA